MPQPRALAQLQRVISTPARSSTETITQETVEAVEGNIYTVRGFEVPGTQVQAEIGDTVDVLWQHGRPQRILNHQVRRGATQLVVDDEGAKSVVEELFIAESVEKVPRKTIWFRNHNQVLELRYITNNRRLYTDWIAAPEEIVWGANTNVFGVRVGERFYIYRLNRSSLTKVYPLTTKPKVSARLSAIDLDVSGATPPGFITVCTFTTKLRRDSQKTGFTLGYEGGWTPSPSCDDRTPVPLTNSPIGYTPSVTPGVMTGTEHDVASVDRVVAIRVRGRTFADLKDTISETKRGAVAVTARRWAVDSNNQLLYTLRVILTDVGAYEGGENTLVANLTGLTGDRVFLHGGVPDPINGLPGTPCTTSVEVVLPFASGTTGDVRPITKSQVNETHTVVLNGNTQAVVFSTFKTTKDLIVEETNNGYTGTQRHDGDTFTGGAFSPTDYSQFTFGTQPGCQTSQKLGYISEDDTVDADNIGFRPESPVNAQQNAIIKSERSLFDPALPFTPDVVTGIVGDPRWVPIETESAVQVELIAASHELPDHCDPPGFQKGDNRVEGLYKYSSVRVADRYRVHVIGDVFWSEGGKAYNFLGVQQVALRPTGFATDKHYYAAFILVGTTKHTIVDYTEWTGSATTMPMPTLIAASKKHVLWKLNTGSATDKWFLTDYSGAGPTTRQVGTNASDANSWDAMYPDLPFYDKTEAKRMFVEGWNRTTGVLTLDQSVAGFPKQEKPLKSVQTLIDLSTKVSASAFGKKAQAIIDKTILPERYRT